MGEEPNRMTARKLGLLLIIQYSLVDILRIDYSADSILLVSFMAGSYS